MTAQWLDSASLSSIKVLPILFRFKREVDTTLRNKLTSAATSTKTPFPYLKMIPPHSLLAWIHYFRPSVQILFQYHLIPRQIDVTEGLFDYEYLACSLYPLQIEKQQDCQWCLPNPSIQKLNRYDVECQCDKLWEAKMIEAVDGVVAMPVGMVRMSP